MLKPITLVLGLTISTTGGIFAADPSPDEARIWSREKAYWEYVKANDLAKYRALWHADFVGWPSVSSEPVHKEQITDWITANTSKGLSLQSYAIEPRAIKVTGDVVIDYYRVKITWAKKNTGQGATTSTIRVTHTWTRTKDGSWQILGGMSAPVNSDGK